MVNSKQIHGEKQPGHGSLALSAEFDFGPWEGHISDTALNRDPVYPALTSREAVMHRKLIASLFGLFLFCLSAANADVISNIQFSPGTFCAMRTGQYVNMTFDYDVKTPGGVRIFPRPFTNGALSADYGASPSDLYTGRGTGTAYFTISTGDVVVDHVRFLVTNADQSQTVLEFFVPVEYHYGADGIYNIQVSPSSPSSIEFNRYVTITFDYNVSTAGGIRIFPRPFTGGQLTPNYGASGSALYTGTGSGAGASFTIMSGVTNIDHIRFQVTDSNQTQTLREFLVPVDYSYAAHSVSNIVITPPSPDGLINNANVNVSFSYYTSETAGVLIFARPFTDGNTTPNYAAHPSPVYPAGSDSGTGYFTITTGAANVDSIRFQMLDVAQTTVLLEYFVPVNFYYSTAKMSNIAFRPTSPAYFTNNEDDTASFVYTHNITGGGLMWVVPLTNGVFSPNYAFQGSTPIAVGSGNLTRHFTIMSGSLKVDAAKFLMMNTTQTETYVSWEVPVNFYFGSQGLTGIQDAVEKPALFVLEQNYPNPFNPSTTITFELPRTSYVTLSVYDLLGRTVSVLVQQEMEAGRHEKQFAASGLASGIYLYRLRTGDFVATKKMLILK
jgi:hypothetical protein